MYETTISQANTRAAPPNQSTIDYKPLAEVLPEETIAKLVKGETVEVTELGLNNSVSSALVRAHCGTLDKVMGKSRKDLRQIRNIGPVAVDEIDSVRKAIWDAGLYAPSADYVPDVPSNYERNPNYAAFYAFVAEETKEPCMVMPEDYEETVHTVLKSINNPLQREAVILRFGLDKTGEQLSYKTIAKKLSVGPSYIGYLLKRAGIALHHPSRMQRLEFGNKAFTALDKERSKRLKRQLKTLQKCRMARREKTEQVIALRSESAVMTDAQIEVVQKLYRLIESPARITKSQFPDDLPRVLDLLGCSNVDDVFGLRTDDYLRFDRAGMWDIKDLDSICGEIADSAKKDLAKMKSTPVETFNIIPFAFLDVNDKICIALAKAGINTAEQFMQMNDVDLLEYDCITPTILCDLRRTCNRFFDTNPWARVSNMSPDAVKYRDGPRRGKNKENTLQWDIIKKLPHRTIDSTNAEVRSACREIYSNVFKDCMLDKLPDDYVETIDYVISSKLYLKERIVIKLRYGLIYYGKKATLQEVGDLCGVVRECVRQIEQRVYSKLRTDNTSELLLKGKTRYFEEHPGMD